MATTWETQTPASYRGGGFAFRGQLLYDVAMPNTSRNPHNIVAAALAIVAVVAIAGYFFIYRTPSTPASGPSASSTPVTTTVDGVTISGGTATVTEVPTNTVKAPDFRIPLTFNSSVATEVRAALTKQFEATVKILEGNKLSFDAWINLGTLRKVTGDYTGAETAWKYAANLYPKSTVPSDNLGSLYLDFLKNYPKAETSYKLSIANDPQDINAYQQLISLYTVYGYPSAQTGKDKALALIEQGLKANPNNQTLLDLRMQLQAQ